NRLRVDCLFESDRDRNSAPTQHNVAEVDGAWVRPRNPQSPRANRVRRSTLSRLDGKARICLRPTQLGEGLRSGQNRTVVNWRTGKSNPRFTRSFGINVVATLRPP